MPDSQACKHGSQQPYYFHLILGRINDTLSSTDGTVVRYMQKRAG